MQAIRIECDDTQEDSEEKDIHSFRASSKASLKIVKPDEEYKDESHTPQFSTGEIEKSTNE